MDQQPLRSFSLARAAGCIIYTFGLAARAASAASALPADASVLVQSAIAVQRHSQSELAAPAWDPPGTFAAVKGIGGTMPATVAREACAEDGYQPSPLEASFKENAVEWTSDERSLCDHLSAEDVDAWLEQNQGREPGGPVFSRICKRGRAPQLLEPLAGVLRDPRFICQSARRNLKFQIEWLVTADASLLQAGGKSIFFDAGGTRFTHAMSFFASQYEKRGIVFDEIYVWEYEKQGPGAYWEGVPAHVRKQWEPRLTFYNGVPVTATPGDRENNPVERIRHACRPQDFCAFKLDIDTPSVELPLVQQLLATPNETGASLDEFFFEHHVHGLMQQFGWGEAVSGTFADSYDIFTRLRKMGVRAHSWI